MLTHWFVNYYGELNFFLILALLSLVLNGVAISNGFKLGFKINKKDLL